MSDPCKRPPPPGGGPVLSADELRMQQLERRMDSMESNFRLTSPTLARRPGAAPRSVR